MPKANYPLTTKDDSDEMRHALAVLAEHQIVFRRLTFFQLKSGPFSFYPDTGSITEDGAPKIKRKGIDEFLRLAMKRTFTLRLPEPDI